MSSILERMALRPRSGRTRHAVALLLAAATNWCVVAAGQQLDPGDESSSGGVAAPPVGTYQILVSSFDCFIDNCSYENSILRYNATTGLFEAVHIANMPGAYGMALHPLRGTLLVASRTEDKVNEFETKSGAFLRTFVKAGSGALNSPQHIIFRPNGNLLVTSFYTIEDRTKLNGINEYSGKDGSFLGTFINGGSIEPELPEDCGQERCIRGPNGLAIGNNNSLYIVSDVNRIVLEYDVVTGIYKGVFTSDHLINPAFVSVRPATAVRPGNIAVTSKYPDDDVNDTIVEFNFTSRQRVSFSPNSRDFVTAIANPGPLLWHTDGDLLIGDRTLNQTPPNFADRIVKRNPADGTPRSPVNFTPSNDNKMHTTTALLRIASGWASADDDNDIDTDLRDLAAFQRCFGRSPSSTCKTVFDDDQTSTIGWADFAALRRIFAGPRLPCTTNPQCDDGNPCTTDTCSAGNCVHAARPNQTPCPDSQFCNGPEVCREGLCVGVQPCASAAHCNESTDTCRQCLAASECDDNNVCTNDTCATNGTCGHANNTLPCNDGSACSVNDRCSGGSCVGGAPPNCNDNNLCTNDSCDPVIGCRHLHNTLTCNDQNPCTVGDRCLLGSCRGGPPPDCNDNNLCTNDVCDPAHGCRNLPANGNACNDNNSCTENDECVNGTCTGDPIDCNDGVACTIDSCSGSTCVHTPNHSICSDGLFCTGAETCDPILNCVSGGNPCPQGQTCDENEDRCGECITNGDCNDGIPCTTDTCNQTTHACTHAPNNATCNDNLFCNGVETCSATLGCQPGTPPNCNDNVACTTDACNETNDTCTHTTNNASCQDGQFCNGQETCHATQGCQPGTPPNCNDNVSCTTDACNEANDICTHTADNAACGDGQFCNGVETCHPTLGCQAGTAPNCNDNVACTQDSCNEAGDTCDHVPNNAACDDDTFCNGAEVCHLTLGCQAGAPQVCNDSLDCTTDSCSAVTDQCQFTPVNARCQDSNACTDNVCVVGVGCTFPNDNTNNCADSNLCNGTETCQNGSCVPGTPLNCDDQNLCTTDSCVNATGCAHANNALPCNDDDPCTDGDVCAGGDCAGTPADCSQLDGPCTAGVCNPSTGDCESEPANEGNACSDSDPCTVSDACEDGTCVGAPKDCSSLDGTCTVGVCNAGTGICETAAANEGGACNDGDPCTISDACEDGTCVGAPKDCSSLDGTCTVGVCNAGTGICETAAANEGGACNDGDPCTISDACEDGTCVGAPKDCSSLDGACTVGVCNATSGACESTAANEGGACTDGNLCTTPDACASGDCVGVPVICEEGSCNPDTGACE